MRISDWSSDVCSSDLEEPGREELGEVDLDRLGEGAEGGDAEMVQTHQPTTVSRSRSGEHESQASRSSADSASEAFLPRSSSTKSSTMSWSERPGARRALGRPEREPFAGAKDSTNVCEIGRASCRERVCQYV